MLDRFYQLNEWDQETGWQTEKGLKRLGLEEVAKRLKDAGRLK
jgi:aldehyde:ferredoxin oxidoreductase